MTGGLDTNTKDSTRTNSKMSDRDVRWLEKPCLFLQRDADKCSHCEEQFSFWRGKKHCEFCGCLFDSKCLVATKLPESFFKARMCIRCHQYKTFYAKILLHGGEFICYSSQIPAAARLMFSESRATLTITIDPQEHFEISLDKIVCIQRGFSHAGHLRTAAQYDPMRCFLISVEMGDKQYMTFDLKAHSAQNREQWVNGLNNAKYVYEKLVDQHRALDNYKSSGKKVPEDGWLGRRYLYFSEESFQRSRKELVERQRRKGERRRSQSDSEVTEQNRMDSSLVLSPRTDTGSPHSQMEFEVVEHSDMVIVEEITSNSSRGTSPATSIPSEEEAVDSPVVLHTQYKLRTGTIPDRAPLPSISTNHLHQRLRSRHNKEWHSKTFEAANTMNVITGLPYKSNNPLASYCECHAYAIEEPRAMLFPAKSPPRDPFSSCCERCRNKCRVVRDLSNI